MPRLAPLVSLTGLLCSFAWSFGETPAPKVDFGFDAATVRPPQGDERPVARVFANYIYLKDLMASPGELDDQAAGRLRGHILQTLLERFAEKERITARDEEIDQFHRMLLGDGTKTVERKNEDESPDARAAKKKVGAAFVKQWKTDKRLFELYGGVVIFQQGNPQEPVGAYRGFMEDMERAKVIEVYDKDVRERVWRYFTQDHGPWKVPAERIDFSKPWWLRTSGP